jgi:hypothetical protein
MNWLTRRPESEGMPDRIYTPKDTGFADARPGDVFDPELAEERYQIRRTDWQATEGLVNRVHNMRRASNVLVVTGLATIPLDYLGDMTRDNIPLKVVTVCSWAGAALTRVAAHDQAAGLK